MKSTKEIERLKRENGKLEEALEVLRKHDTADRNVCLVCMDAERTRVYFPCGHVAVCDECDKDLRRTGKSLKCPFCNQAVTSSAKVHVP
jgi:hypothetical protein